MTDTLASDFVQKINAINASTAASLLQQLYHTDVEFIYPVKHIHGRAHLIEYFEDIYKEVKSCSFELQASTIEDNKSSLEWEMKLRHNTLAPKREICLSGISVLRYRHDLVYYQRDYYDLGAMVYEQIPILGAIIRKIRGQI